MTMFSCMQLFMCCTFKTNFKKVHKIFAFYQYLLDFFPKTFLTLIFHVWFIFCLISNLLNRFVFIDATSNFREICVISLVAYIKVWLKNEFCTQINHYWILQLWFQYYTFNLSWGYLYRTFRGFKIRFFSVVVQTLFHKINNINIPLIILRNVKIQV